MAGFWITLVFTSVTITLLTLNFTLRWSSTSGGAALTGVSLVFLAFVTIGALIDGVLHNAAWLRDDPGSLWFGIIMAPNFFVLGAIKAAPWLIANTSTETTLRQTISND